MNHDHMMDTICEMESEDFARSLTQPIPADEAPAPRRTQRTTMVSINSRVVTPRRLLSFAGQRGMFIFRDAQEAPDGRQQVNVWGPVNRSGRARPQGRGPAFRTFFADNIRTVHNASV